MLPDQLEQLAAMERALPKFVVESLDDEGMPLQYFDDKQVFHPAFYILELDNLGNHECGAMTKDRADALVALRNAAPELIAVVRAASYKQGCKCHCKTHGYGCGRDMATCQPGRTCTLCKALAALSAALPVAGDKVGE